MRKKRAKDSVEDDFCTKFRVIISNATRLHAHRHAAALQTADRLDKFATSIWHRDGRFPYIFIPWIPTKLRGLVESFLSKRTHNDLLPENVQEFWIAEIARICLNYLTFGRFHSELLLFQKIRFDKAVARLVKDRSPHVFVGFEISCLNSFVAAKKIGATVVLDLAGVEHEFSNRALANRREVKPVVQASLKKRKQIELQLADRIICVSDLARRSLLEGGIESSKIEVIHLGVDHKIFKPDSMSISPKNSFKIIYVGNISSSKGVDILVKAFCRADIEDGELIMVGSLADFDSSLLNAKGVQHLPYMNAEKLASAYRSADLFVLPSLLDSWGMVVPEAMACGLPVVVTDMCGSSELVNVDCGWVVPAGDPVALSGVLQEASEKRLDLAAMGVQAATAVKHLSWEGYENSISDFYRQLVAGGRGHAIAEEALDL